MVWPPPDCRLSPDDRVKGAEIVMAAAKYPVILGVHGSDPGSTRRYARHAQKIGPRAVMAGLSGHLAESARRLRSIANECGLLLMAHVGSGVNIESVLRMRDQIDTLRLIEDSAAHTLSRISEYRRAAPELTVFTNGHGRTLPDELERGAGGVTPPARLAEAYVRIWDHCLSGRRDQSITELSQLQLSRAESA